ncbi:MAG: tRNA (adenosine(37)-N6)-threonylcarbamoyltransferase complex dimerization subunit type 1 TsaB [Gammaproteobacteria bacterium]|nr:tRNA (adenosine(37)-N6)-threonylcarbamoyltransferase complex dimerization subunit type 1 TsaB [Gammaproteobacteria bacterium]
MPRLLAIDTSTDACSVALLADGEVHRDHRVEARAHARLILPMIDALLSRAGVSRNRLDGITFGCGPGSFTGLRIAASVVQGIAWPLGRLVSRSSLELLARSAMAEAADALEQSAAVLTLVDARMDEVYWNLFAREDGDLRATGEDALATPEALGALLAERAGSAADRNWILAGDGLRYLQRIGPGVPEALCSLAETKPDARWLLEPAAADLAAGRGLDAAAAVPVYLRDERRWRRLDQQ